PLQVDHREVAQRAETAVRIVDVGDAAGHAGREVAPGLPEHRHHAAGHVFAAVVAHALDDGHGARVAHGETLAGHALEVGLAGDGAVEHGVADDDVLGRLARRLRRLAHDHAAAGKTLADLVVGVAGEV